jgi:hypothetical protein
MSVHYTFDKDITLSDIKEYTNYEISKPKRARYFIIKKDDNNWLQASLTKGMVVSSSKKKSSVIEDENAIPIDFFIGRGYGGLLIKELSLIFQSKFLTDTNVDEIIEIEETMKRRNVENFGLFVTKSGYIVQTKEECDSLNEEYDKNISNEITELDFSFNFNDNELEF